MIGIMGFQGYFLLSFYNIATNDKIREKEIRLNSSIFCIYVFYAIVKLLFYKRNKGGIGFLLVEFDLLSEFGTICFDLLKLDIIHFLEEYCITF